MIKKILKIKNVGLLQDATLNGAVELSTVTAIYAENGRGKSTFAAVMRACQLADAGRLSARKTIDIEDPPEIDFLLPTGARVEYRANTWIGARPEIVVFDSEFVEQNVYSGFEVRADQRQALLEFALGDQIVQLKQHVDQLTKGIEIQSRNRREAEKTLTGFISPYNIEQFIALQPVSDAQQQINALKKRQEAANNAQALARRQSPTSLQLIQFDMQTVFNVLKKQLVDIEQSAEAIVKAHLAKHDATGLEDWVGRGQEYLNHDDCPFCGQKITGLELINVYQSYFNKAYAGLKQSIDSLESQINTDLADSKIEAIISAAATNTARIEAWKDQVNFTVPQLDGNVLRAAIGQVQEQLLVLVTAKRQQPLVAVGTQGDINAAVATLASINQAINSYNTEVAVLAANIDDFKKRLATDDSKTLEIEIKKLEAILKRQRPEVCNTITDYQSAEVERKRLDAEKVETRQRIDVLMQSTLQQYQTDINQLISDFGAEFSIEQLKPSYVGSGEPRTEYVLSVRDKRVKLGNRTDLLSGHSFGSILSEADKRTLAFSFFIARLKSDPNRASKVVILDDPVSSLDRNRRYQSIRLITSLATECKQMIILSHDPFFVRDLCQSFVDHKTNPITPGILTIKRVHNGYSALGTCNIEDICSSDYYRHHRIVTDYVDGKSTVNNRDVAKAIRPLLEGYYHRRFPDMIPRKLMFGQIIARVVNPVTKGPLTHLKSLAKELGEINDYVGQFHHDSADTIPVIDSELLTYARRALNLIYQNG